MTLQRTTWADSALTPLALVAPSASSEAKHDDEHRQQRTHIHGVGALNAALEGQEVHVEFNSPSANIVGFEHAPATEANHAALDRTLAMLKDGDRLFRFNDAAGCRMENVQVVSELLDEDHKK